MNCVVCFPKRSHFIATHTTITAVGAARLFLREGWEHHGATNLAFCDRGRPVVADFTRELYRLIGIKLATSIAYLVPMDEETSRVKQELEQFLRLFVNQRQ